VSASESSLVLPTLSDSNTSPAAAPVRGFGMACASLAGAIGCFWVALWVYGTPDARAFASANCKTNTCVSLVVLAVGYVLLLTRGGPRRRAAAAMAMALVGTLGALTLVQYLGGVSLGIDELFARDTWSVESGPYPNRMSPSAALCFVLLALCPWLITQKSGLATALGQACAVVAFGVCSIALIGYLYSATLLYRPLPFIRFSPYTAAADTLLVAAAFAMRPDIGLGRAITSTSIGGYLARRLLPITLLLPVVVGWLLLDGGHQSPIAPAESHALLATSVALVMAPTVLFLALSLDRLDRNRLRAEEFLRSSAELTSALARARTVDDVVSVTLDLGVPALGARAGGFVRLSEDGRELRSLDTRGYPESAVRDYRSFSIDENLPASVAVKNREPLFIGSIAERDAAFPSLARFTGHGSWAVLPLEGTREVLGAITLSFAVGQRFDKATRARARQLAWQCAQALDRALLFDSEQQARQRAEAASRAKDEFLAMLGHELRNPLSPILTSLHLMELRDAQRSVKEREVIKRQVSHMVRLVDDLLDVSRIASGRIELKRRVVELSTIVSAALELTHPLLEQRKHRVVVEVPEKGLPVHVDRDRMVQVVSNLLTNSAKYSSVGGMVELRAECSAVTVALRVSDNGVGIPPELLGSVFDLFVQGARTLDRSQGGLGLGLSLVKSLVELHGGSVGAKSEGAGRGSEFWVTLPRAPRAELESTPQASVSHAFPARSQRILLVDDNRDAADSTAQALREAGHEVRVAYDGPSALDVGGEMTPSLALLDIGLPVMDGYELARRLREQRPGAALKLVALTGYGQKADRENSRQAGFDAHLVKPVAMEELLTLVSELGAAARDGAPDQAK
jgi:signal transduction histidine kinase/ActR/RegA family two-component response regulator